MARTLYRPAGDAAVAASYHPGVRKLGPLLALAALAAGCGGSPKPASERLRTDTNSITESPPRERHGLHTTALVKAATVLRDGPRGRALAKLPAKTEWGSPSVVFVAKRRDGWLGVVAPQLPNNEIGWIPAQVARVYTIDWALRANLAKHELSVIRAGRVVRRIPVAVGAPGTPTPAGRFAVTDKLLVEPGTPYGCCVVALSGHQPNVPQGWGGGDRIAIHTTTAEASVGSAASHGCLRAHEADVRVLLRKVPLGTPIYIKQ